MDDHAGDWRADVTFLNLDLNRLYFRQPARRNQPGFFIFVIRLLESVLRLLNVDKARDALSRQCSFSLKFAASQLYLGLVLLFFHFQPIEFNFGLPQLCLLIRVIKAGDDLTFFDPRTLAAALPDDPAGPLG